MTEPSVGSPLSMHDPRSVGPWAIHSRLGAGGMGVVYYATNAGRSAAVKVIRPGLLDAPATRDRFRREVNILRSVRDLHICRYVDADLESEPAWLALEYLSGPVLRDEVANNGPLAPEDWWDLARGLAQALAVLGLHRVTHRDLKPGNVILNERGPVLIDFGIAHPEDATQLTATGLVTGSPAWLAPEQANLEPTGPASDIFTLGSLLAYAATGRPPFGEGASVAVLMSIIKREPDLEGIDPARQALLRRLMVKDPALRPTAQEVLELARLGPEATLAALGSQTVGPETGAAGAGGADMGRADPGGSAPGGSAPGGSAPGGSAPGGSDTAVDAPLLDPGATVAGSPLARAVVMPATPVAPAPPAPAPTTAPPPNAPPVTASPTRFTAPAPPPARTTGARVVGPRTAAAQERRARRRRLLLVVLAIATVLIVGWTLMSSAGMGPDTSGSTGSTGGPASAGDAPPAPGSDQLRDGDWLLESYRLDNTDNGLVVSGTVRNRGTSTASADLTVWVYRGDESLGSVSTTVTDVAAGAAVPVTMTGDAVWKAGQKVVLLDAP